MSRNPEVTSDPENAEGADEETRTFHVRLKPYNARMKHKLRRYTIHGMRFEETRGWYEVPEIISVQQGRGREDKVINLIDELEAVHQIEDDDMSPKAFDICQTREEALAMEEADKRAKEPRATANAPIRLGRAASASDLSTRDLRTEPEEDFDPDADIEPASAGAEPRRYRAAERPTNPGRSMAPVAPARPRASKPSLGTPGGRR